jgi:hypothetical protein
MPTPDASQFTQFRRYASVSADAVGSVGSKISPFNTAYSIPMISASSQALFLPSANKEKKFVSPARDSNSGAIFLDEPVTNPIIPTGSYDLYTFTPTENGWYRIIVDGPGGTDMDLAIGYGNSQINIPAIIDYDLNDPSYGTPPETPIKVFSFRGGDDYITSYFSAGCTYQVLVIGYDGDSSGTYTLTVRDNTLTVDVPLVSTFYYTGSYQLYRFVAPNSHNYRFRLYFTTSGGPSRNDADIFVSEPNTTLDIQGCIDFDNEEGPPPESLMVYGTSGRTEDLRGITLTQGSTYEILVYQYNTAPADVFDRYTLTVSLEPEPPAINNLVIYSGGSAGESTAVLHWDETNVTSRDISFTPSSPSVSNFSAGTVTLSHSSSDVTYAVTITVTNAAGSTSATINVTVGCFLGFVKVITLDGPVAVEDVVVGTKILQPTGKYSKVVELKRTTITDRLSDGDGRLYADAEEKMVVTYWHKVKFSDESEEVKAGEHPRLHQVFRPTPFDVFHIKLEDPVNDKVLIHDTDITAEGFIPVNPL